MALWASSGCKEWWKGKRTIKRTDFIFCFSSLCPIVVFVGPHLHKLTCRKKNKMVKIRFTVCLKWPCWHDCGIETCRKLLGSAWWFIAICGVCSGPGSCRSANIWQWSRCRKTGAWAIYWSLRRLTLWTSRGPNIGCVKLYWNSVYETSLLTLMSLFSFVCTLP